MNTFYKIQGIIKDIPVNKWVCIIIRVKDKTMDVFINGIVTKIVTFRTPPRQNYEDVRVHASVEVDSCYTSNLEYWNYALGTGAINSIAAKDQTPSLQPRMDSTPKTQHTFPASGILQDKEYVQSSWKWKTICIR